VKLVLLNYFIKMDLEESQEKGLFGKPVVIETGAAYTQDNTLKTDENDEDSS
jgi:hypothetical protein